MFLGLFDKIFLRTSSGLLLNSIGVVLLPQLMSVEAQLAEYLGGFGQQIVVALIVMLPLFDLHRRTYRGLQTLFAADINCNNGRPALSGDRSRAEFFRRP
jgi:hypothetical protein